MMTPRLAAIIARQYQHLREVDTLTGPRFWAFGLRVYDMYGVGAYYIFAAARANGDI